METMKNKYFYTLQNNVISGPFLASTLDRLCHAGTLSEKTPVSTDKVTWLPLEEALYKLNETSLTKEMQPPQPLGQAHEPCAPSTIMCKDDGIPPKNEMSHNQAEDISIPSKDNIWEVIGESLHLLWNTPDKLESMVHFSQKSIFRIMLPTCLLFVLLLSQAAAFSVALFWGRCKQKSLFVLLFTLFSILLFAIEILLIQLKHKDISLERVKRIAIVFGMSWINFGAVTCIGSLHFALVIIPAEGAMPLWVTCTSTAFFLFVCCFFFSNLAAGLRIGFSSFFDLRPRVAVWWSAFFLWQYFILLYAGYYVANIFLK